MNVENIIEKALFYGGFKSQKDFALKLDIDSSTISQWKRTGNIPKNHLKIIEEIVNNSDKKGGLSAIIAKLEISEELQKIDSQRIFGDSNIQISGNKNKINQSSNDIKEDDNMVVIPYFENTYAAAGTGYINYDEAPTPMSFDKYFLKSFLGITNLLNLHVINSIGLSMEPTIKEGCKLFIFPFENESNQIKDGGIYVIWANDTVLVKRMSHNPITGSVVLKSDNKEYDDINISKEDFRSCKIIGRVVGQFSNL